MSADFDVFAAQCRTRADAALKARLPAPDSQQPDLAEAMAYCLFNGGKRIRPTLVYATGAALGATDAPGLDTLAAAVECVHATAWPTTICRPWTTTICVGENPAATSPLTKPPLSSPVTPCRPWLFNGSLTIPSWPHPLKWP